MRFSIANIFFSSSKPSSLNSLNKHSTSIFAITVSSHLSNESHSILLKGSLLQSKLIICPGIPPKQPFVSTTRSHTSSTFINGIHASFQYSPCCHSCKQILLCASQKSLPSPTHPH